MLLVIAFKKSLKNVTLVAFLELFGHEQNFETQFEIFLENVFPKVIWKSFYF
jgi:hypothetical protein